MRLEPTERQRGWVRRVEAAVADMGPLDLGRPDGWQRLAEAGLTGLQIEAEWGGAGLDPVTVAMVMEAVGRAGDQSLVLGLGAHLFAGLVPLWRFGTPDQRDRWLRSGCGGRPVAFAATEAGAGSSLVDLATTATLDGNEWTIDGSKTWITNTAVARSLVVLARTESTSETRSLTAFVLDVDTPGVEVGPPSGGELGVLPRASVGRVDLSGVRVGEEAVLGEVGGGLAVFQEALDWERSALFAGHVGTMDRLLKTAIRRARRRRSGGRPVGDRQSVAHRLAELATRVEAARWLVYQAASKLERPGRAGLAASMAKLYVSTTLEEVARTAAHLHGAEGLVGGGPFQDLVDAAAAGTYSGTTEIQLTIIGRWLGLGSER